MGTAPQLSRGQILTFRRRVGALDERLPRGRTSLRRAAWAGLQDSMPRAALLSIHARVAGTRPTTWEDPSLVQLWGPRYSAYVVAARDLPVFSLGRSLDDPKARAVAEELATGLRQVVGDDTTMTYEEAGRALGVQPNQLRYAATTGTVVIRWDGARRPTLRIVDPPTMDPAEARRELVRRYLHVYGPTTSDAFARWSSISRRGAAETFRSLGASLMQVRTPIGDAWILASDEEGFRASTATAAPARLLPSGDAYFLLHGADRAILVPDARWRSELWTSRVWPGAVLVHGQVVGTWRRADAFVAVHPWRRLTRAQRDAVEAEAYSFPLPGIEGALTVRWEA